MTVWVDADSCPSSIRKIILQKASEKSIQVVFAANRNINPDFDYEFFTMHICQSKEGAADDYILENAKTDDLVVTRDIPLAERLLLKNITTINDRGLKFSKDNIRQMMEERELHMQMVNLGIAPKGNWKSFSEKEIKKFRECLESLLP
ncbi:MAG: DUF188 domain-containing protein [Treponema sp.]|nr:DUF188 domain-containing protein [Treponema sp.]